MIPADCRPGEGEVVVEVTSPPDGFGRQHLVAYWPDDSTPDGVRGQHFHMSVAEHATWWARQGREVRTVSRVAA